MNKVVRGYKRQFWRGVAATLAATYGVVLVLVAPTYAVGGGNTVSLTVDTKNAELKQSSTSDLYKATTKVTVDPAPLSGFDLTIHATSADLVNNLDSRYRIKGMDKDPHGLLLGMNEKSNLWGYRVEEGPGAADNLDKFLHTPAGTEKPSVIVDTASEHDNAGCKDKKQCTVNVTFGASLDLTNLPAGKYSTEVTYTATAKPKPGPTVDPTTCKSGDSKSTCRVDLDHNMIPVKYTGSTTNAQWTSVADPEAADSGWYDYANKQWANAITVKPEALSKYRGFSKVVDQADILGFWVYIPRYRYKVLRYSGSDPAVPAQNFTIEFENKHSTKATPTANGTWATHPAFIFGTKELNGIWFAKFETTGSTSNPTVLPGQSHINYNNIGIYYSVAKSIGVYDPQNVGGNSVSITQNSHHLAKLSSHMVNNNDWGAATYLSASKYGAGYNGVHINPTNDNTGYNYNTNDGQLTSTTNNPTGIYDMSGGGWEYTAASYTTNLNESGVSDTYGDYFGTKAHPPYVNTYNFSNFNSCTYQTCGGQSLYETNLSDSDGSNQWNNNYSYFARSSYPWFARGGIHNDGSNAGLFYANGINGNAYDLAAFRVALAPTTQD